MIHKLTIQTPLNPWEALAGDLYRMSRGDLAMFLMAVQQHEYTQALLIGRVSWGAHTPYGLPTHAILGLMVYLRNAVVHP